MQKPIRSTMAPPSRFSNLPKIKPSEYAKLRTLINSAEKEAQKIVNAHQRDADSIKIFGISVSMATHLNTLKKLDSVLREG